MHTASEWAAFGAAVLVAGGFASALLWIAGRGTEVPRDRLWRIVATLWLCVVMAGAALLAVRHILGGGIVDYDAQGQSPVRVRQLTTGQWWLVSGAVAWMGIWLYVAMRTVRAVTERVGRASE